MIYLVSHHSTVHDSYVLFYFKNQEHSLVHFSVVLRLIFVIVTDLCVVVRIVNECWVICVKMSWYGWVGVDRGINDAGPARRNKMKKLHRRVR